MFTGPPPPVRRGITGPGEPSLRAPRADRELLRPRSGGLRTALTHLGAGYAAAGHEVLRIVPGPGRAVEELAGGVVRITVPAPRVPGTGGYRMVDPFRVQRLLRELRPDCVEVSDRLTLRGLGRWAGRRGVRSLAVSHERVDRLLGQAGLPPALARALADRANARTAAAYDTGAFLSATRAVLAADRPVLRRAARARAERFPWSASVRSMLALAGA